MARYARDELGYRGTLVLEQQSRSTWENIAFAIPLVREVDRIKIVSVPPHADKARRSLPAPGSRAGGPSGSRRGILNR